MEFSAGVPTHAFCKPAHGYRGGREIAYLRLRRGRRGVCRVRKCHARFLRRLSRVLGADCWFGCRWCFSSVLGIDGGWGFDVCCF